MQALQAKRNKRERLGDIPYGYRLAPNENRLVAAEAEQASVGEAKTVSKPEEVESKLR